MGIKNVTNLYKKITSVTLLLLFHLVWGKIHVCQMFKDSLM